MNAAVRARVEDGSIRIATIRCEGRFADLISIFREVPGRSFDAVRKEWVAPATTATARKVRDLFSRCELISDQSFRTLAEEDRPVGSQWRGEDPRPVPVQGPTTPWRHQAQAYWFARDRGAALLNMGLGTGKSRVVVDLTCSMEEIRRVLVLCPKSVVDVWPRMFATHGSAPVRVIAPDKGSTARKAQDVAEAFRTDGKVVVVLNYEAARFGHGRKPTGLSAAILSAQWDLVVLDESHRIKSPSGLTSRFCARLRDRARRRLCLTGTPMPASPLDIFGQFRFLDPAVFGQSFVAFRLRYSIMGGWEGREVIGFKEQEELARLMDDVTFSARTEDVLDLPPFTDIEREFDLAPEEARVYKALERDFVAAVKNGEVTAANALVKLLRLAQVTGGAVVDDDRVEHVLGDSKARLLAEVLEECGAEPVAVFCRFRRDIEVVHAAAAALGRSSVELSGGRNDIAATGGKWEHGQVLAVQEQAGGVGVDLTRARYLVFYSLSYSLGDHLQARGRVRRPGQDRPVTYIHLIARGTVDRRVREALSQKQEVVRYVLDQI